MDRMGVDPRQAVYAFEYDFDKHGGAIGTIELTEAILEGEVCKYAYILVDEQLTSAGAAEVALGIETTDDVLAAVVITGFTAGATIATLLDWDPANFVTATANQALTVTVSVADLTAGKMVIVLSKDNLLVE